MRAEREKKIRKRAQARQARRKTTGTTNRQTRHSFQRRLEPPLLDRLELGLDELEDLPDRLALVLEILRDRLPQRRMSRIGGGTPGDDGLTMFLPKERRSDASNERRRREREGQLEFSKWRREICSTHLSTVLQLKLVPPRPTLSDVGVLLDRSFEPTPRLLDLPIRPEQTSDDGDDVGVVRGLLESVGGTRFSSGSRFVPNRDRPESSRGRTFLDGCEGRGKEEGWGGEK